MDQGNAAEICVGSRWRHKKGKSYKIIAVALDSDDPRQQLVVYVSLEDTLVYPKGTVWVRSLEDFRTPGRFTKIREEVQCH
jgi:hypothetical protein